VAHHRAQFGLAGHPGRVSNLGHLAGGGNVIFQAQAGAVDHHRGIAQANGLADMGYVIHRLVVLIDHGDMVQVQPDVIELGPFSELGHNGGHAAGPKFHHSGRATSSRAKAS